MQRRAPAFASLASLWITGVWLAAVACDRRSPSEPGDPPAASSIVVIDPNGQLAAVEPAIRGLLTSTFETAARAIPAGGVTFLVSPDRARAIPGYGLGGYTPNAFTIEIVADPAFLALAQVLPDRLPPLAAHELHHAARWRGPGYGVTLLEAMVSEGMADHFAVELLGAPIPPWSSALSEASIPHYMAVARPLFDSTTFDFGAWFFGTDPALPRWTGYALGFRLVERYLDRHPGTSAAGLVHASAELFRPD